MIKLPNKLSELITIAIKDLIKCERSPKYIINMGQWHDANSHCTVCLAGSVMAQSLGADHRMVSYPNRHGPDAQHKLQSLDSLRLGAVSSAGLDRGYNDATRERLEKYDRGIAEYERSPKLFKKEMLVLARDLEAGGF